MVGTVAMPFVTALQLADELRSTAANQPELTAACAEVHTTSGTPPVGPDELALRMPDRQHWTGRQSHHAFGDTAHHQVRQGSASVFVVGPPSNTRCASQIMPPFAECATQTWWKFSIWLMLQPWVVLATGSAVIHWT